MMFKVACKNNTTILMKKMENHLCNIIFFLFLSLAIQMRSSLAFWGLNGQVI